MHFKDKYVIFWLKKKKAETAVNYDYFEMFEGSLLIKKNKTPNPKHQRTTKPLFLMTGS